MSNTHRIVFSDGKTGVMTVISGRKGSVGSISFITTKGDDEEQPQCHLLVSSVVGTNIIDIPEPAANMASQDPIAEALANREILERVVNLFPTVSARTMTRTEMPTSNRTTL